jgi:hypothetical protein
MHKKILFVILFSRILISPIVSFALEWKELGSEHFIVYFTAKERFAREVLDKSEGYYRNIASGLGYPRYSAFWTWDKRVKIYIYPEHSSFVKATGQPEWSHGMARYRDKIIFSYAFSENFLDSMLPHEIAHLIFRDFVGFKGEVPLWLDEGVAQWAEEPKRAQVKIIAPQIFSQNLFLPLPEMMKLDIRGSTDQKLVDIFYIQASSLVNFLIERYGSYSFADFCRQLRDGKSLDEAIKFAYPDYMHSVAELEARWKDYLKK